ncbi:hypothetical protein JXA27_06900 [Aerococcaceae bacterium zg-B36]|uniref:hypothetical protein n=1 Tax=Aerococcaceae bacterium zg-252 TaxID=2796928 RepID=UPI001BD8B025|nr:hypothetical protein [Aerococcaceae bacterium zg-B36]
MYNGSSLQKSMDTLADEIRRSKDNEDQLVRLYKQQVPLIRQQIDYHKDIKGLQGSEIEDVLSKLRGYGFKSSGNKITNLDHAKSLSGDSASEAEKLLNQWKKLYESLNSIDKKISDFSTDITKSEKDLRDAQVKQELKQIEKTLKRSEYLLRAVENNTDLQATKEKMLGKHDYELSLAVNKEGMSFASAGVKQLIDEFNRLSVMVVKFEENTGAVQHRLEELKDKILDNADAILDYREKINQINLDRLSDNYDKFSDAMSDSIERITSNINQLKEGLVSGTTLSDFNSSTLGTLDFRRMSQFEQDHQTRLKLEADLNNALDHYAKANVDRTIAASKSILNIEKNKYENLLNLAKGYASGFIADLNSNYRTEDIGVTHGFGEQNKAYKDWENRMSVAYQAYSQQYSKMVSDYDKLSKVVRNTSDKQALNSLLVLNQLRLQEQMYKKIVESTKEMIQLSRAELNNTTLTTEQRQEIIKQIKEYENESIKAEKAIRDTIKSRYEFEFDLMDKAAEKAKKQYETIEHLKEIADIVNLDESRKRPIFSALFQGKASQYTLAKEQLRGLLRDQAKLEKNSLEWNLLEEKIENARDSVKGFGVDLLNLNKDILHNNLDGLKNQFEKGILDGRTLDDWKSFRENWVDGVSKEIELETLRKRLLDNENEVIENRLEMLDLQKEVSKKDLEYLDKQMKVFELENKLKNIEGERKVQELIRNDDGTWGWGYSADQTEYDKTNKELQDATKDLDKFKQEQRTAYAEGLANIIGKANNGSYKTTDELRRDLESLRGVYGAVLNDIPEVSTISDSDLLGTYQSYLAANGIISRDLMGGDRLTAAGMQISRLGYNFDGSFMNTTAMLGQMISTELQRAMSNMKTNDGGGDTYQIGSLVFPNVTDTTGFQSVLENLAERAKQEVTKK